MRVEIADGAVHLAEDDDARKRAALALEARGHIGEFLADGGGRGRLSVRSRQHGDCRIAVGERIEQRADGIERRQQQRGARALAA